MLSTIKGVEVVAYALDGTQAIEMARQHKPNIVFLDIHMSKVNGLTAHKQIVQENPSITCILVSAENHPETFQASKALGIQNYLIKPFTEHELDRTMQDVIQRLDSEQSVTAKTEYEKHVIHIRQLAEEYVRTKRTDEEAVKVFEEAVELPDSELAWLQTLAMIYVARKRWDKLKVLAEKLEQRTK